MCEVESYLTLVSSGGVEHNVLIGDRCELVKSSMGGGVKKCHFSKERLAVIWDSCINRLAEGN